MNVNEVISNRVIEILGGKMGFKKFVYFNDYVNCLVLFNDIFFIVMYIVVVFEFENIFFFVFKSFCDVFQVKVEEFEVKKIIKIGCIYFQDVIFLIFVQEFSGYVVQFDFGIKCVEFFFFDFCFFVQGGIVVGIGINIFEGFVEVIVEEVFKMIGIEFKIVFNKFEVFVVYDVIVQVYGSFNIFVVLFSKIVQDICYFGSGFCCGFGEFNFFENEFGLFIMFGKVNFIQCEVFIMVCVQVMGNQVVCIIGGMNGQFEFNVYKFLIICNFFYSICILVDGMKSFEKNFVVGFFVNEKKIVSIMKEL